MFRQATAAALALVALSACQSEQQQSQATGQATAAIDPDPMTSRDPAPGQPGTREDTPLPVMQAQVVLERLGFAPGIIDGKEGLSTRNALAGFQLASSLPVTGKFDPATMKALAPWSNIAATRVVTIPEDFARGPFAPLPKEPTEQARLVMMGYASFEEKLAERFHTTPEVLRTLNPSSTPTDAASQAAEPEQAVYRAGQQLRVPNVGADAFDATTVENKEWAATMQSLGVGTSQPGAERIVVSKSAGTLKVFDKADKLVALFTVTTGSDKDPLPIGDWTINGKAYNPKFSYDAGLFWDVPDSKGEHLLPPGPNGPVGVVWIDLSKEHYGIHGTPAPHTIGRAESHGCVRLTNWDAARLAQMVSASTRVSFVS